MINSMTGFASGTGSYKDISWAWELRSVNGKGLDLRVRAPDWISGLEAALKSNLSKAMARGNVTLSLRISREEQEASIRINKPALIRALELLEETEAEAMARGISLAPSRASDVLAVRGVLESGTEDADVAPLAEAIKADLPQLLASFTDMRAQEGAALHAILTDQLAQVETLVEQAAVSAEARRPKMVETLQANLARVLETADQMDPNRIAQELALLAVKSDVTEELDRLKAHVASATALLAQGGPVGRKLDFLMQEFNREANTLCSKAQAADLTAIGLDLKAVIDQMREQVQNIE